MDEPLVEEACFLHIPHLFKVPSPVGDCVAVFDEELARLFLLDQDTGAVIAIKADKQVTLTAETQLVLVATRKGRGKLVFEKVGSPIERWTCAFTARRGLVARQEEETEAGVVVECFADLPVKVLFDVGLSVSAAIQKKGEMVRVRVDRQCENVEFRVEFPGSGILTGSVPRETGSPFDRFKIKRSKQPAVEISGECKSAEIRVGETGRFVIDMRINKQQSQIPVKCAFRLTNVKREAYLLAGTVAGMRTLLPGVRNEFEFEFVPLSAGFHNLPGIEIELLPGGSRAEMAAGPRFFAVPVSCTLLVRE